MKTKNFTKSEVKKAEKTLRDIIIWKDYKIEREPYCSDWAVYYISDGYSYITSTILGAVSRFTNAYETIGYDLHWGIDTKYTDGGSVLPVIKVALRIK
jgi:hypothetical protein